MWMYIGYYVKWDLEVAGLNLSVSVLKLMSIDRWVVYPRSAVLSTTLLNIIAGFIVFVGGVVKFSLLVFLLKSDWLGFFVWLFLNLMGRALWRL